jgi:excisionase family DNA binding protein
LTSHSVTAVTLPRLFCPAEIAEALGCSEWWVKEQARQKRIPFTRIGGAYRFTAQHATEIVVLFEERPTRGPLARDAAPARRPARKERPAGQEARTKLVARPPRRMQQTAFTVAS